MHGEHGEAGFLRRTRAVPVGRKEEHEEVESVIQPRVIHRMGRGAGEPPAEGAELGRALQWREELRVSAGEVVRDGEVR